MDATVEKLPLIDIATVADAPPVAEAAAKELEKREKVTEDVTPEVAAAAAINPEQTQTGSAAGSPKGAEAEEVEASEPQQCTTSPENGAEASPAVPDNDVKDPPPQEEEEVQSKVQPDDDLRPNNGATAEAAAAASAGGGESENGDVPKSSDEGAPNAKEEAEAEQEEEEEVKVPREKERPDVEMQQQKQNNGREVMMPKRKLVDVQPVKMMRIRSWKSSATILKKRSIKWLNKNKYQLGRERNAFERQKDAADVLKEGSMASFGYEMFTGSDGGGVGKKVKGANGGEEGDDADEEEVDEDEEEDEEEEEEDFEVMENQAKRSRMDDEDDDVEIVVTKKRDGGTEKVFCDRKNGKKGGSSNDDVMTTKRGAISPSSHHQQQQQQHQQGDHPVAKGNETPDKGKQKRDGKLPSNAAAAAAAPQTHLDDPTKKLCLELEMNFASHDKMLTDYIEGTANESVGGIQRHVEQLIVEIQTLSDMIRAKEMEWNNMLHLKKVKEEIVARLTRRRHVMEFASAKFGMTPLDYGAFGGESKGDDSITKLTQALLSRAGMADGADGTHKGNSTSAEARNSQHLKSNDGNSSSLLAAFGASAAGVGGDLGAHTRSSGSDGGLTAAQATAFANDLFNGHNTRLTQQMGRQGAIKDVKSIIADYRQRHPEVVPRRGRRMKPLTGGEMSSSKEGGGNSRPSSADSSHSNATNSNFATSSGHAATQSGGAPTGSLSFKDVLVQFAKLSQSDRQMISTATEGVGGAGAGGGGSKAPPPYPEVTLYPVSSQSAAAANEQMMLNNANNSHSNSLLHGILTKSTSRPNAAGFTSFSPTLARLLTAPERITNPQTGSGGGGAQFQQQLNPALNLSKSHSEITITPVVSQTNLQQSLLQQQQQQQRFENCNSSSGGVQIRMKQENVFNIDDEADDSADRLVIDEGGGERNAMDTSGGKEQQISIVGQEFHENEVPECQGCKKREAQFVCAGCGNQWYCSRECQVSAWDEHSEVCTG